MAPLSDSELIHQLQEGSLEALGVIYDRYCSQVYRTALAITSDVDAANDLMQDVFLRLFRFSDRIDGARPLQPWLYRITANLSYTWVKRDHRWLHSLDDIAEWLAGSTRNSPYEYVESRDIWDSVQRAIARLPISQRIVVVLYYLNDLSLQEISETLELPVGTVKSRLHYGRQALKKSLGLASLADSDKLPSLNYESP